MTRSDSFALDIIDTVVLVIVSLVTITACVLLLVFGLPHPEELVKEHLITMADVSRIEKLEVHHHQHSHRHHHSHR